jgi:ADP-ribose pyrophosphatase YjhB (NUDIX family)
MPETGKENRLTSAHKAGSVGYVFTNRMTHVSERCKETGVGERWTFWKAFAHVEPPFIVWESSLTERSDTEEIVHVAALIQRGGRLLMVEAQGPDDLVRSWVLPGGRVEPGESLVEGLTREVREETGLILEGEPELAFSVRRTSEGVAWLAHTFLCAASGTITPNDPDELILSASWIAQDDAIQLLDRLPWYDPDPLRAWLDGKAAPGTLYDFSM